MPSPDAAFRRLIGVLDSLRIPFFVGGSVASSTHGVARATMDVDLIAGVKPHHIARLVADLEKEFYADPDMISQALSAGRAFNLVHYATSYKFDIFPLGTDPYQQAEFERRVPREISLIGDERFEVPLQSAEDTLLSKLAWYRAGGGVSERQWNDIRGIIEIQGDRLDRAYMHRWATHLNVADLLERALSQPGQR